MPTKQEIREYFAKFGKEGGKTRARNMTAEQRKDSARKASLARWQKNLTALESKIGKRRATRKKAESALKSGGPK